MYALWLVAKHEYRRKILTKGFVIALLSIPLLVAIITGGSFLNNMLRDESPPTVGYVDHADLLAVPANDRYESSLQRFASAETARAALEAEEIVAYYVVPRGYPQTQQVELVYVREPSGDAIRLFQDLLRANLLADQPPEISRRAIAGSELTVRLPGDGREFSGAPTLGQLLPALGGFALIMLIFVSSGYLLQAVTEEKNSRTMEILTTSISPSQLMTGKILGILGITLTLLVVWSIFAVLIGFVGGNTLGLDWLQETRIDAASLVVTLVLLIPSYILVAALMTAIGATLMEGRSGQQITALLATLYLSLIPFLSMILRDLEGPLAIGMSFLPLTAPIALPLRTAFAQVPFWQIAVAVTVQSLCALGALWIAGRAIRVGMLRYGRRLRWGELFGQAAPQHKIPKVDHRESDRPVHREGQTSDRPGNGILLILRHELVTTITRPSFLLACVGIPLFIFGQMALFELTMPGSGSVGGETGTISNVNTMPAMPNSVVTGYVDQSGLIQALPENIPPGTLLPYANEASAREALETDDISAFYIVPRDYLHTGELIAVRRSHNPLSSVDAAGWMNWLLLVNLLGGDTQLATRVWSPMDLQATALPPDLASAEQANAANPYQAVEDNVFLETFPMLVTLLLYGVILMSSGLLIHSVSEEKKNRVIEVLLVSVTPQQMLTGKIVALGLAGLFQAVIWGGMGYLLFSLNGWMRYLPPGAEIPPSLLVWGIVYFLLGYALYGSLMAGAGALIPNLKESPMVSLLFALPALIGFEISLWSVGNPHGVLSTAASIFPLTAPISMINRLVIGGVPLWQVLLSVGLTLVTIPLVVRAVSRMFHAQNLLSGQPFSVKRYFRAILGQA